MGGKASDKQSQKILLMRKLYKRAFRLPAWATAFLLLLASSAEAQIQYQENFDYAVGNLYGQGGWVKYATNPDAPMQVVDETLDYDGYPGGVRGKSVKMTEASMAEDLVVRFDPSENGITEGSLYYSALINVETAPEGPMYVMSFVKRSRSNAITDGKTGTELGKLFLSPGEAENTFSIGVERNSSKPAYASNTYLCGQTYLLVVKYEINEPAGNPDIVSLYVNPSDFSSEPAVADAVFTPSNATSGVGTNGFGLQGFELRQAGTSSKSGPVMLVGSLRIADSWAGLFGGQAPPAEDKPVLSVSQTTVDFGTVFAGDEVSKIINVKGKSLAGDVALSGLSGEELTASSAVIPADEAQAEAGADVTFTLRAQSETGSATATFASEGAQSVDVAFTWSTIPVTAMSTLQAFSSEDPESYLYYRYTGQAVVTFVDRSGDAPVYYLQDETGGTMVKDDYGVLAATYKEGDLLTGFIVMAGASFGVPYVIPCTSSLGTLLSEGNATVPVTATLSELKANAASYVNRLVRVDNATISGVAEGATFEEGMAQPVVTDATGEGKLRIFKGTSLIGTAVPTGAVSITGLYTSKNAVLIAPRSTADIEAVAVADPSMSVSPTSFGQSRGYVGEETALGTVHVSAISLPGETYLEITGKNRDCFRVSTAKLPAGSSETDVTILYAPTSIGKHAAYLNIDCPSVPELSQTIALSGISTDRANPPVLAVEPTELPAFAAKAGETQEQTIQVTSANTPDYVYLKVKGQSEGAFRISATMLVKNLTSPVKVTFAPKKAGTYTEVITIWSEANDTLDITVSGTATEQGAVSDKEGDQLPLSTENPRTLLQENFDGVTKNAPLSIDGWKNLAVEGTRAWWGYEFGEADASAGEKTAKVTPFDSQAEIGEGTPCEMMLVTPPLDFVNSASKIFTFRVRGDYLQDNQSDRLELCYLDMADGEIYQAPVEGFTMPALQDQSGEWQEYHVDLTGQPLADVFFMGFRFTSTRGRDNAATYYIDDVSWGRTDLPVIRTSETELAFTAKPGQDAASAPVDVTTTNLALPVTLSLGGANKSKFKLSATELPAEGGTFSVSFNSDEEGVHEAYVKLASRGAADVYVVLSVLNSSTTGTSSVAVAPADIRVSDLSGRLLRSFKGVTSAKATEGLPTGVYLLTIVTGNGVSTEKVIVE